MGAAALALLILLGAFSCRPCVLYLLGRTACILEATFVTQKLEEGVNLANLVREELFHSVMSEVSITLFYKLPCL